MDANQVNEIMTFEEVCALTRYKRSTVIRAINEGIFPTVGIKRIKRGKLLFSRAVILKAMGIAS